jgi:DNA repair exonuclease SbcCD ATPase subunit
MTPEQKRIGELEDALKDKERRIEDLRDERDRQAQLITKLREQLEECDAQIERWIEAFDMQLDDKGLWIWNVKDEHGRYLALLQEWNRFVPRYNATVAPRNMGRPLGASEAQRRQVLRRRKSGESLRSIAEDMTIGLRTVRTIVEKVDGVDRATLARLNCLAPDRAAEIRARRISKDRAALPKRINENLKRNAELIKGAKGLE